jgi:16S rRNA (uracil1498-N3)-methyltransferase
MDCLSLRRGRLVITLLVTPAELESQELQVEGESYRHLFRARRLAVGETLRVVDGAGRARFGSVAAVERSAGHILLGDPAPANEPPLHLELFCPLPKPDRTAWLVEKVTEIGVSVIRFLASDRAPRELGAGSLERLRRVAASAVEQSQRARLPELSGVHPWSSLGDLSRPHPLRVVLDARGVVELPADRKPRSACLLIGPEGGFTAAELEAVERLGFVRHRLGARILRTETAAVAGAALLLHGRD